MVKMNIKKQSFLPRTAKKASGFFTLSKQRGHNSAAVFTMQNYYIIDLQTITNDATCIKNVVTGKLFI